MKNLFLSTLLFFAFGVVSWAQEGIPVYFDYLSDNYYLIHPSMAGIGEGGKVRLTARKQWFDVDDAPNLQTINAHFRVGEKSGVGAIIFNDANGYHSQTGAKFTYAHHLKFSGDARNLNQLSFGLSGTILQSNLDETEFRSTTPDPAVVGSRISSTYFNTDLGVSYNYLEFYAHATILNLLSTKRSLYAKDRNDDPLVPEVDNLRRYVISTGYVFDRGDWQFEPSVLFQMTDFTSEKAIDFNAKAYRGVGEAIVWGGISYRRSFDGTLYITEDGPEEQKLQLITPIVGVNYKKFMVSYNYSYQMGDIRFDNGGFHQITLGYDFLQSTKRYDCKCPAVNY
ncbi:type IX secretion system membrane protein PorP/SprF [Cellulophaga sp. HaHaR_3_176]|uniref:PorP/SprF family type IX secretion system membrane protein n=1 Tax=Cellulophaga sp. HaHaR_3_176 TaxID=1942464 RepID=UPI001C1F5D59|nr:type IX secretion system membrane protein PorP/SprF [Cellulophaga sp. HaHaR_3_176]QWX84093.1 type IX secretion system membrane protein PorP/SprF [Cellulophaga sp. HaHaR_3_176]